MNEAYMHRPKLSPRRAKLLLMELGMLLVALIFLYPFYIVLSVAVKSPRQALMDPSGWPTSIYLDNFAQAFNAMRFPTVFANSVLITGIGVLGIVVLSVLASYPLAKAKAKGYQWIYLAFVCGIMVPFHTTLVPLVKTITDLRILNSRMGLIVVYWGRAIPFAIFLYTGFIRGISSQIIEAAEIDGAGQFRVFRSIVLPLLRPITATVVILNALDLWNDFLLPLLTLSDYKKQTIPLSQYTFSGRYGTQWQLAFAGYVIAMTPIIILYMFLQKHIVKGVAAGALKG